MKKKRTSTAGYTISCNHKNKGGDVMAATLLLIAAIIFVIVFNIIKSYGKNRKAVIWGNIILFGIPLLCGAVCLIQSVSADFESRRFEVYDDEFGDLTYQGCDEAFYYIRKSSWWYSDYIAVPKTLLRRPVAVPEGFPVRVYGIKGSELDKSGNVHTERGECSLGDTVVKIRISLYSLALVIGIIGVCVFVLFNGVEFIIVFIMLIIRKKQKKSRI